MVKFLCEFAIGIAIRYELLWFNLFLRSKIEKYDIKKIKTISELKEKLMEHYSNFDLEAIKEEIKKIRIDIQISNTNSNFNDYMSKLLTVICMFGSVLFGMLFGLRYIKLEEVYTMFGSFSIFVLSFVIISSVVSALLNNNLGKKFELLSIDVLKEIEKEELKKLYEEKLKIKKKEAEDKEKNMELKIDELTQSVNNIKKFIGIN